MKMRRVMGSSLLIAVLMVACAPGYRAGMPASLPQAGMLQVDLPQAMPAAVPAPGLTADDLRLELRLSRRLAREEQAQALAEAIETTAGGAPALAPLEPRMPAPGQVAAIWRPLDESVRQLASAFPGRMSVVAIDLTTGDRYDFRARDRYLPASTFKLPVTICTVQAIERGELTWETPVAFTEADDDTVGQGGFATAAYGSEWPVRNLVDRSIISSNNVAVKMLARTLTWDGLAACTQQLGGMVTRTEAGSTPVTAGDEAAWWMAVWRMKQQTPAVAENLLRPLRQVTYQGRIQAGTPRPDLVTHKFGTYPPYEHDGALIWGDRPYILVVLTYGGDHAGVDDTIAAVAAAAWDAATAYTPSAKQGS